MTTNTADLNGLAKYQRIAEGLRDLIIYGRFKAGATLPDLEHLAANAIEYFGITAAIGTVRAAEEVLIKEGTLAQTQQGIPTRILKIPTKQHPEILSPLVSTASRRDVQELPVSQAQFRSFTDDVQKILQAGQQQDVVVLALGELCAQLAVAYKQASVRLLNGLASTD